MTRLLRSVLSGVILISSCYAQSQEDPVCEEISRSIGSASAVFYPGNSEYEKGIYHWASSSSQPSKCVVEPSSADDVGKILQIIGRTGTKFSVKSGGHASNPGFSSTPGVHIYMGRFSSINYDAAAQTVEVGSGLIWDDVYAALEPYGVNVVGGRVTGIGVGGFALGGGYSWKSNQYGLSVDTVTAYELVKPDGSVVNITSSDEDLFFALKGGLNNFGIVTKFTLKTHPQSQVWGGLLTFPESATQQLSAATASFFAEVTDPKASLITNYLFAVGMALPQVQLFYDGPTPPAGIFERFTSIPTTSRNISTRSFRSHFLGVDANATAGTRSRFETVSLTALTPGILNVTVTELQYWAEKLGDNTTILGYSAEPFLPAVYSHNISETAFPAVRSPALLPFNINFAWSRPSQDDAFVDAMKQSAARIAAAAISQGQHAVAELPEYPNYASNDRPLEKLYGSNLERLKAIKAEVDPQNVMGLAGGFKI